ncbi:MAG: L-threonylcarbamoyladenylate synthase [Candidatus Saccharibacteria bacterium]|nr:L-threonylcarbamoyladenylate synthase [Candidatus Saccharibacteria bacterium]
MKKQILKSLKNNEIATVPTETVEGFAILLNSELALKELMSFKNRDFNSGKIFTLVPASPEEIEKYAIIPDSAKPLIEKYVPGELTLILPKNPDFKHPYYDHFNTIGIRIPNHPLFEELLPESGALILTSANKRGETPKSYGKKPSTIIDFTSETPKIIRQGDLKVI